MTSRHEHRKDKQRTLSLRDEALEASRQGEHEQALRWIDRAIADGPGNARTWFEKGNLLVAAGDDAAGEAAWRRAIALKAGYADALEALARSRAEVRDFDAAFEFAERCLEADGGRAGLAAELERWRLIAPTGAAERAAHEPELPPLVPRATAKVKWDKVAAALESAGCVALPGLVAPELCAELRERPPVELSASAEPGRGCEASASDARLAELAAELYAALTSVVNRLSHDLGRGEPYAARLEHHALRGGLTAALVRAEEGTANLEPLAELFEIELDETGCAVASGLAPQSFEAHLALGPERVDVHLIDTGPGGRKKPRKLRLAPGDVALVAASRRPVRIGGALGLLPVRAEVVAGNGAKLLTWAW